ncbi:hypothetical protein SRHO_G00055010 [Serrasalmus rhombeus]
MGQWPQLGDFDYHFPSVSAQQLLVEISGMAYRDLLTAQSCYSRCQAGADVDANSMYIYPDFQQCCGVGDCSQIYTCGNRWPCWAFTIGLHSIRLTCAARCSEMLLL